MFSLKAQINRKKEEITAISRAIMADESLQVEFKSEMEDNFFSWNQNLAVSFNKIQIPEVKTSSFRAAADMAVCYLLFHDSNLDIENFEQAEEQKFYDEFEKIRVIAQVKNNYRGLAQNILQKIEEDIYSCDNSLSLLLLAKVFGDEIATKTRDALNNLEQNLDKKIVNEIEKLAKKTGKQKEFAKSVKKIIEMLKSAEKSKKIAEDDQNNSKNDKNQDNLTKFSQENNKNEQEESQNLEEQQNSHKEAEFEQEKDPKISKKQENSQAKPTPQKLTANEDKIEFKHPYKIFTSKFDEVVYPQKLINKNELELLRDQLDLRMTKLTAISKKMTLQLKRKLLSKRNSFSEFDASGGIIDRKKLSHLLADPLLEDIWIKEKTNQYQDTALTILLDNSGSMRGNPIVMSALACEIIAQILEKFSVKTEIIGFTTADWKGGRARKMWEASSQNKNPGRLNELRHIIYKDFEQKFRNSKDNLGLMLKEGVLKENIDGEALLFARSRLMQRSERRKILLVISDGTPIDDSTNSANDSDILSDHLSHVVNKIEKGKKIELVAIGIGHSADQFYSNSITIKALEELGDVMIKKISELL